MKSSHFPLSNDRTMHDRKIYITPENETQHNTQWAKWIPSLSYRIGTTPSVGAASFY
jgi:hypothetical protein